MTLSDDEYIVLTIANEQQSMMAIGKWQSVVNGLVEKGLMHRHDQFNNTISSKGRQALFAHEEKVDLGIIEAANKVALAKSQAQFAAEEAARQLVIASRATNAATGQATVEAANTWAHLILQKALEKLSE